jgi:serine/threonine-protein kinase
MTFTIIFDWVTIPAGDFLMGSTGADKMAYFDEKPQHQVYLPEYRISLTPVTNRQYSQFVAATGHRVPSDWKNGQIPSGKADHPVVEITWHDAQAFCTWAEVRLPTEAEWEKAARGPEGRIWPWGNNAPTDKLCNFDGNAGGTTSVGHYPEGKSFYGCLDMAGNVWEWTSTIFKDYPYKSDDGREDTKASGSRTLRGGSWIYLDQSVRCAYRITLDPDLMYDFIGFRVVNTGS